MDRGTWQAIVHRVSKSQTQLKWLNTHTHTHTICYCETVVIMGFFLVIGRCWIQGDWMMMISNMKCCKIQTACFTRCAIAGWNWGCCSYWKSKTGEPAAGCYNYDLSPGSVFRISTSGLCALFNPKPPETRGRLNASLLRICSSGGGGCRMSVLFCALAHLCLRDRFWIRLLDPRFRFP